MVVGHGDGAILVHEGRVYRVGADRIDERVRDGRGFGWERVHSRTLERELRNQVEAARRGSRS